LGWLGESSSREKEIYSLDHDVVAANGEALGLRGQGPFSGEMVLDTNAEAWRDVLLKLSAALFEKDAMFVLERAR